MSAAKAEAVASPKKREAVSRRMVVHERCANKACGAFSRSPRFFSFRVLSTLFVLLGVLFCISLVFVLEFKNIRHVTSFRLKRTTPTTTRSERDADVAERLGRSHRQQRTGNSSVAV